MTYDYETGQRVNNNSASAFGQLVSSYVSSTVISASTFASAFTSTTDNNSTGNYLACQLNKYKVTRQTYFRCSKQQQQQSEELEETNEITPGMTLAQDAQLTSPEMMFMIFQDVSLFGFNSQSNSSLYTNLNQSTKLINYDLSAYNTPQALSAQVAGLILSNNNEQNKSNESYLSFNLTLEIKMPDNYYTLLSQIETKLINRTHELNEAIIERMANATVKPLTDLNLMVRLGKLERLIEKETNPFDRVFRTVSEDAKQTALLAKPLNYSNDAAMSKLEFELNEFDLNDSVKVQQLRDNLINKWYMLQNYQLAYSNMSVDSTAHGVQQPVKWSDMPSTLNCHLYQIDQAFSWNIPMTLNETLSSYNEQRQMNDYRIFSRIQCIINGAPNSPNSSVLTGQFVTVKHATPSELEVDMPADGPASFQHVIRMIDQYAELFNLDMASPASASIYRRLQSLISTSYETFDNRMIYFSAIGSCLLFLVSAVIYSVLGNSLQMPRSFYHLFANIWLSVFFLIATYTLGIRQINIPHLCLATSILCHYLTLCVSIWHTLYFYSLFAKLYSLKDRNFDLLFNGPKPKTQEYKSMQKSSADTQKDGKDQDDSDYEEDEEEEVIQKPVLHYYLMGWGLPLLLCAVIISITKQNYLTVPYGVCFTNNMTILVVTLIVPVAIMFLMKLVFCVLIMCTLRRIVNDLKATPEDLVAKLESNDSISDKLKLCQNWADKEMIVLKQAKPVSEAVVAVSSGSGASSASGSSGSDKETSNSAGSLNRPSSSASNHYSDQTSIMDSQHKPHVQLKFAFASYLFFGFIWVLGKLTCKI